LYFELEPARLGGSKAPPFLSFPKERLGIVLRPPAVCQVKFLVLFPEGIILMDETILKEFPGNSLQIGSLQDRLHQLQCNGVQSTPELGAKMQVA